MALIVELEATTAELVTSVPLIANLMLLVLTSVAVFMGSNVGIDVR